VKASLSLMFFLSLVLCRPADAQTVTFDFNSLGFFAHDFAISNYMTDVYGSAVATDGALSSNNRSDVGIGETNFFIATSFQLLGRGDFEVLFEDLPIIGAQFEGHVIDATIGDDFKFIAYAGSEEVFRFTTNDGVEIFDSGWLDFSEPVDRIVISDSGRKDVGIDDFTVQAVPEPAGLLLLIAGASALAARRRGYPAPTSI